MVSERWKVRLAAIVIILCLVGPPAFAKSEPQRRECHRLTSQIADAIMEVLAPQGVGVVIEAEHLCLTMRGIKKPGSVVVTSANRGLFRRRMVTRQEFLTLIGYQGRISS